MRIILFLNRIVRHLFPDCYGSWRAYLLKEREYNYSSTLDLPLSLKLSQMGLSLFSSTRPQPVQRVLKRDPCSSTTCSEPTAKTIFITRATRQMIANPVLLPTCTFVKLVDILSYHHDPPAHTSLRKWHVLTQCSILLLVPTVYNFPWANWRPIPYLDPLVRQCCESA